MRMLRTGLVLLSILCCVILSVGQEETGEFRSIAGRFGIQLPKAYSSYNGAVPLDLSTQKFLVSIYRWNIPMAQFSVSYAGSEGDLETAAGDFLAKFRERILQQSAKLIRERQTDLDGHPGFELITESADVLTISQVFAVKNRFYYLTMSLNPSQRADAKAAVTAFNSFRLLPQEVVDAELSNLVDHFAPEPLPQEPFVARPTNDCQDESFKGKVKTVVQEREDYQNAPSSPATIPADVLVIQLEKSRVGNRTYLHSQIEFNERCNRVRYVEYSAGLPSTAIVYGFADGERVATLAWKPFDIILVPDGKSKDDLMPAQTKPKIEALKFKYKYNNTGQLLERRILFSTGREFEKLVRDPAKNKLELSGGGMLELLVGPTATYQLDDKGNPIEKTATIETSEPFTEIVSGQLVKSQRVKTSTVRETYTYAFDSQGNWTTQVTSRVEKKDGQTVSTPINAIRRRITYF